MFLVKNNLFSGKRDFSVNTAKEIKVFFFVIQLLELVGRNRFLGSPRENEVQDPEMKLLLSNGCFQFEVVRRRPQNKETSEGEHPPSNTETH